jgi:hypothetical protein
MRIFATTLLLLLLVGGCGDIGSSDTKGAGASDRFGGSGTSGGIGTGAMGSGNGAAGFGANNADGGIPSLPPETEQQVDLQLPQASQSFVYTTNPQAGTVSVIDAVSLEIRTLETGDKPTYLRTLAKTDNAIVLNIGSNTATVIRSNSMRSTTSDLDVVPGANAIGVAPDGKHAVVYYNSNYTSAGNGSGSFQDVSVLSLSTDGKTDASVSMTVGFRPRDVFFAKDNTRAFVVTEDGVSILDFAAIEKQGSGIAHLVQLGGGVDQKTLDVAVTPDGAYALARAEGKGILHLVNLGNGNVRTIDIEDAYVAPPAPPVTTDEDGGAAAESAVVITDLDMMPDGTGALAVLRNQHALITLPIPAAFDDVKKAKTRIVKDEIVGSVTVSPDAHTALLYTTAAKDVERITLIDLTSDSSKPNTVALRKAVDAVVFTPTGTTALITHKKLDGDPNQAGISQDDAIDRSFGYSLLRVPEGDVKLQVTQTAVGPVAMVPDGSYLFLLFRDDALGVKEVHRVQLASFLVDPIIPLESPPISIGTTAETSKKVFVNQDHPDGRMTFIDWTDPSKKKTVTGFELNSRIRD